MPHSPLLFPLLRDAPVAVASLDLDGLIVDVNSALLALSGYTIDELRGRSFVEFVHSDAGQARARFTALATGTAEGYRTEQRLRTRGGDVRDAELSLSLVRDGRGRPAGFLVVMQDVTGYKQALRDAARRAAELEAVLRSIPAAVYIGDANGVAIINDIGLQDLGFASLAEMRAALADDVVDRLNVRDAATGAPVLPHNRGVARALRGERVDTEFVVRHGRSGADRIHRIISAPILLDGAIAGAVAISQDITERKRTEEALRLSEERYRALVEQSPLSVQILSPSGTTLHVNGAWERLWGVTLHQISDYNMLEDQQLVERGLMPYIRQAFSGSAVQIPAILYDPNQTLPDRSAHSDPRRWVRAVAYPLKNGGGEVREVVLIHEDMTEQVKAEERRRHVEAERERLLDEAQRAHRDLQAASRVKDEFLATLSHELRTPLNAVLGWARILRTRSNPNDIVRAAEVIERNAVAQARLIDDLLDLSRIITGKIRLTLEPVDLGAVANVALESVRPAADAKRITIAPRIAQNLPSITADGPRLQQVFWNLLSNAVKFTESGGLVTVTLTADDGHVHGEVSDTGIGIAPNVLPFVFDRFMQGDSSSTRAHSGLGLGLAIVRHLVELHGGTVRALSAGPAKGATFRFSLPRA